MQTNDWDTHQQNARQGMLHENLFASLITLVETLEGAALLDETLVVVLSEMGRTPRKNADDGKDHWPVTSALLFGAGVRGGRVLDGRGGLPPVRKPHPFGPARPNLHHGSTPA